MAGSWSRMHYPPRLRRLRCVQTGQGGCRSCPWGANVSIGSVEAGYVSRLLGMMADIVQLAGACFYLVDDNGRARGYVFFQPAPEEPPQAIRSGPALDASPAKGGLDGTVNVITIGDRPAIDAVQSGALAQFREPQRLRHEAQLLFRNGARVVAGISLLRSDAQGPFSAEDVRELRHAHAFLEHSMVRLYLPHVQAGPRSLGRR